MMASAVVNSTMEMEMTGTMMGSDEGQNIDDYDVTTLTTIEYNDQIVRLQQHATMLMHTIIWIMMIGT